MFALSGLNYFTLDYSDMLFWGQIMHAASVRLHFFFFNHKQAEKCLRQMADEHVLQVHCQFVQLKRLTIQTQCCCRPRDLKGKWKAGGLFSSSLACFCCYCSFTQWQHGELSIFPGVSSVDFHGEVVVYRDSMEERLFIINCSMKKHAVASEDRNWLLSWTNPIFLKLV